MVTTPNRGYELQPTGGNDGTWGVVLNSQVFSVIDLNLGGSLALDVTGSSDVTVSDAQARNAFIDLTGTLAGNISLIIPTQGASYIIRNGTTGSFTITVKQSGGAGVIIPQGFVTCVFNNTSGGETFITDTSHLAVDGGAWAPEVNVAAAATADVLGVASFRALIAGAGATITSLGTGTNRLRLVRFNGVNTLVHNATSLILPSGANIITAPGDTMILASDGASNVRAYTYVRAAGLDGAIVQSTMTKVSTWVTTSSVITTDDSVPQSNEGISFATASLTPLKAGNLIRYRFAASGAVSSTGNAVVAAAFVNGATAANSVAAANPPVVASQVSLYVAGEFTASDITAQSVMIRVGAGTTGTIAINGLVVSRLFGGATAATLVLEEVWKD